MASMPETLSTTLRYRLPVIGLNTSVTWTTLTNRDLIGWWWNLTETETPFTLTLTACLRCSTTLFQKVVSCTRKTFSWNSFRFQEVSTTSCGQYCALFCLLRSRGYSFDKTLDLLRHNDKTSPHFRDHVVHELLNILYPLKLADFNTGVHDTFGFM